MSIYDFVTAEFGTRHGLDVARFNRRAEAHLASLGRSFVDDPDNPDPAAKARREAVARARRVAELRQARRSRERAADKALSPRQEAEAARLAGELERIRDEVCMARGVSLAELLSPRRGPQAVAARQECMWRMREETTASLPQIGRALGGRDHTTVLHGLRRYAQLAAGGETPGRAGKGRA